MITPLRRKLLSLLSDHLTIFTQLPDLAVQPELAVALFHFLLKALL